MFRGLLVLVVSALAASAAFGKDLCIQVDRGFYAGSQVVVKKAKIGARNVAPAQGYLARYTSPSSSFSSFIPMAGQSVVGPTAILALGMTMFSTSVGPGSSSGNGTGGTIFNCVCTPGLDGKLGVLDTCSLNFDTSGANGHIVACSNLIAIPAQ